MNLSVGIIGLPNVGKSTLFNALLGRQIAEVAEYPFTTIEPHTGVVEVPDERLARLCEIIKPEKCVPAAIKFIDIAGLVKDAHKGEGLGNQFLAHIREVDAILHVVRAFENPKVPHVSGKIDPKEDIDIVNLELELAGIKKPMIYILNVLEKDLDKEKVKLIVSQYTSILVLREIFFIVCAKLEAELSELSEEEQGEYLEALRVDLSTWESGVDKIVKGSYKLLDLITFYTVKGGKQVQAWPLKRDLRAIEAAEIVHTDFAKNFIKAEVIDVERLLGIGSWKNAREKGLIRTEGKSYVVVDGDVIEFLVGV